MQAQRLLSSIFRFASNRNLLYGGIAVMVLVIIATTVLSLAQLRQQIDTRTTTTTQYLARSVAQTLEGLVDTIDLALLSSADEITRQISTGKVDSASVTHFLTRQQKYLAHVQTLGATNEYGDIIYGLNLPAPAVNISDRAYFIHLRNTPAAGLTSNQPFIGRISQTWVWNFARRINKPDGSFGGVVFAVISIEEINKMLAQVQMGNGSIISLRDAELGLIAAHAHVGTSNSTVGEKRFSNSFLATFKANPLEGSYSDGADSPEGIEGRFSYARNAKYNFLVNVGISNDVALTDWRQRILIETVLALGRTLALLVFAWLIRRAWRRQEDAVDSLQEAQQIAHLGHYSYDLATGRWTSSAVLDDIFGIDSSYPRDTQHWLELVDAGSREELETYTSSVIEQRLAFDYEYRIIRPGDGAERWVHGKGKLQYDAAGTPLTLVGTIQDITKIKLTQNELKRHQTQLEHLVQERTAALQEAQQIAHLGHYSYDFVIDRLTTSAIFDDIYGIDSSYPRDAQHWRQLIAPDCREETQAFLHSLIEQHLPIDTEYRIVRPRDGAERWVHGQGKMQYDSTGMPLTMVGTVQDITERKRAEAGLRLSASVFAHSYDGIIIADADNVVVDANPAATRITGYTREELIGQASSFLASGRKDLRAYNHMRTTLRIHDFWQGEVWNRRKNGDRYPAKLAISCVHDNAGRVQHYIGVFSDISQIKEHKEELHRIAHYDILTGIPNRRLLADRLAQAIARTQRNGKPFALCYLDLDGFKPVNDQYGHNAGDRLLVEITARLKSVLRAEDTLARLGGDEFVMLFSDLAQPEEYCLVLDRVLAAVNAPLVIEGFAVNLSASIGVTLYPADDVDPDTLLRHADQAMYLAKEAGKNCYHLFNPDHDRQLQTQRSFLKRLHEALDHHEFVLYYQPKVDLLSGDVIGAEALIRWQHPEQGLLPPNAFLHYLYGSDLEMTLGEWVIESALHQIELWHAAGLTLPVSVNVSADHLLRADFAERLRLALERHPDVLPGHLELEILETAALADMKQAVLVLNNCRELGVSLALDDFGTGYSSLTYFRELPVQMLKIDQSFVRDMLDDPNDLGIVEGVVQLARAFNRPVIAEGVETLEHGAVLARLGCHLAQGYGIARPMPAEQIFAWLEQWHNKAIWFTLDSHYPAHNDVTLLVAAQSHRNWIDKIVEHLDDADDELAVSLDSLHCRFGHWYQNSGAARYGKLPEFKAIALRHEQAHLLAAEIVALANNAQKAAAWQRVPELYEARDRLISLLNTMAMTER